MFLKRSAENCIDTEGNAVPPPEERFDRHWTERMKNKSLLMISLYSGLRRGLVQIAWSSPLQLLFNLLLNHPMIPMLSDHFLRWFIPWLVVVLSSSLYKVDSGRIANHPSFSPFQCLVFSFSASFLSSSLPFHSSSWTMITHWPHPQESPRKRLDIIYFSSGIEHFTVEPCRRR